MTLKEALYFTARCLTISTNEKNKAWVQHLLIENLICWDKVIKQSTAHYVLPTLYCNLKRQQFLQFLPNDLVKFMDHLTNLNRVRNEEILSQVKEINTLLLKNNITPVFIKGTSFILQNLYADIAERMISDIDFIVSEKDCLKAHKVLVSAGYASSNNSLDAVVTDFRHLPRLMNNKRIAAVEIHHELILKKYRNEFNYNIVSKDFIKTENNYNFLSYRDQISLAIIATQINDSIDSVFIKKIRLRNSYDIYLLSQKTNTYNAVRGFNKLYHPLNNYLAISKHVLNIDSIRVRNTSVTTRAIKSFNNSYSDTKILKRRILLLKLLFIDVSLRKKIINRMLRKSWRTQKLIEFGLKKR